MALRIGFFGAGLIARYHSRSLRVAGRDGEVVAVFDPDRGRAEAFAVETGAELCHNEAEVIERSEAVYVCTWTSEHPRLVEAAAREGRAVFCEKPLAVDLPLAEAMHRAVDAAGVCHQVGLVLRSSSGFALVRHLVSQPSAGRVVSVSFRDDQQLPVGGHYGSDWRADASRAGAGTLLEHSIHDLDLLEWLFGPLARLSSHAAGLHGLAGIDDTVSVAFALAAGGTGALTSVWHDMAFRQSNRRLEVLCEHGRYWAEGNQGEVVGSEEGEGRVRTWDGLAAAGADSSARAPDV
ncbi:MAG: hypothetical protein GEV08_09140, partial [Acidimicrobiia bacterium]|nr:hypothetical protein [Acidimicrobiia bacterium]